MNTLKENEPKRAKRMAMEEETEYRNTGKYYERGQSMYHGNEVESREVKFE
jgi:hypothetical protein